MHRTILAIQIVNHKILADRVSTFLNKSSGHIYQLLKLTGVSQNI